MIALPDFEGNCVIDYEVDGQGYAMVVSGETAVVFYKVIIHPQVFSPESNPSKHKYELKF